MSSQVLVIGLLACTLMGLVNGDSYCDDMYIGHHGPQLLNNPYEFKVEKRPEENDLLVQLVISEDYSASSNEFYSFLIEARDASNEEQIGSFTWDDEFKYQYMYSDCSDEYPQSTVTNTVAPYRESVTLNFEPSGFEGDFYFKAAAVQDHHTWWNNINSDVFNTSYPDTTLPPDSSSSSSIQGSIFTILAFILIKLLFV